MIPIVLYQFSLQNVCLVICERANYLSEFTRAAGGEEILDRRDHAAKIRLFGGSKASRTRACTALLDTGSPASFIEEKVWQEMLACGPGSDDGRTEVAPKNWGGFHGVPLITSSYVRLNIQLENIKKTDQGSVKSLTVCLVVFAHVVPQKTMPVRLEPQMYAMVRETRPELSHEQAREMATTCSREPLPVAAPPADHFPALARPPFIPPPLPMAPPPAPT